MGCNIEKVTITSSIDYLERKKKDFYKFFFFFFLTQQIYHSIIFCVFD